MRRPSSATPHSWGTAQVLKNIIPNRITPEQFPNYEELRKKAASLYIGEGAPRGSLTRAYVKLLGDVMINNAVHEFAEDMTMAGHTVYLYSFEYNNKGNVGIFKYFYPFSAATHGSELPYLFSKGLLTTFTPDAVDLCVIENFTTIFTNFAKYGDPNGVAAEKIWVPLTPSDTYKYLCITNELEMKSDYQGRRAAFWRELNNRTNDEAVKDEHIKNSNK
uniref:Carboxylic ester hydrolase n=1 Tax=Parascaris univalens TaxID=6257 RepID=A0A914ZHQ3_PARUN